LGKHARELGIRLHASSRHRLQERFAMHALSLEIAAGRRLLAAWRTFVVAATILPAILCLNLHGARAQATPAPSASPGKTGAATQPQSSAGQASRPVTSPPPARSAAPGSGGTHEGIKVHGHWMIEVKSPEGKLVSHTEFENNLSVNGASSLTGFLAQNQATTLEQSYTPGEWGITLSDPTSPPCSASIATPFNDGSSYNLYNPLTVGTANFCILTQLAPPAAIYPTGCPSAPLGCSYNLSLQGNSGGNLVLSGTVISEAAGTISQVQTLLSTCASNIGPAACWNETAPDSRTLDFVMAFTTATLPASNTTNTPCGGTGQVSCAVTVPSGGDTISVTVTISFQ
jgi:hypothetical protein